jgi:MoxR-like ATPase
MTDGRTFVTPEDIKTVAPYVLLHRMSPNGAVDIHKAVSNALSDILTSITLPTEDWTGR